MKNSQSVSLGTGLKKHKLAKPISITQNPLSKVCSGLIPKFHWNLNFDVTMPSVYLNASLILYNKNMT